MDIGQLGAMEEKILEIGRRGGRHGYLVLGRSWAKTVVVFAIGAFALVRICEKKKFVNFNLEGGIPSKNAFLAIFGPVWGPEGGPNTQLWTVLGACKVGHDPRVGALGTVGWVPPSVGSVSRPWGLRSGLRLVRSGRFRSSVKSPVKKPRKGLQRQGLRP